MAFPVYSSRLLNSVLAGAGTAAFLVPAGYRLVVRDVDIFESNPGGAIVELAGGAGVVFAAFGPNLTSTYNYYAWRGRQVLEAGEQFEASTTLAVNVVASGYLFTVP